MIPTPAAQAASAVADRPVVPFKMAHLVLRCADYRKVVNWYLIVFDARVVFENDMVTFITFDDEHHRAAFVNTPDAPVKAPGHAGIDHVAYSFRTIGELLVHYERLKAASVQPVWCINHGPTTSIYYRDPEGTMIEFQVDNYADPADAAAFFHTPTFTNNPLGIEFNPDEMVRLWRSGKSDAELSVQGTAARGGAPVGPIP
ncbi:VOC family protein [Paraburkholderia sp. J63]|uniref:VOC family protein n=1 Tax=Paraburkholderia sp. J63 TaxID=2805434 RepID=UPI002ABE8481|nr:VOC family protein [Paraburkholderia sp. J63]